MGCPALAEDFAPFRHVDPSTVRFKCIYPLDKGRCCENPVDRGLRKATSLIKRRILDEPSSENRSALLQQFVENCCCKGVHRKKLTGSPLLTELCQRWERELGDPPSTPVGSSDDTPHAGPTTAPESTCENDVESPTIVAAPSRAKPRYDSRSNGSRSEPARSSAGPNQGPSAREFEPMNSQPLASALLEPLSPKEDRKTGDAYAFSRESSKGMLKIGWSEKAAEPRVDAWGRKCRYKAVLQHCVRNVPHARRVETLTHSELRQYRRREVKCKHNPDCPTRHKEWFQCSVETAARSMDNLAEWMVVAHPYDADGFLKPRWEKFVRKMVREGREVTSQSLLDALELDTPRRPIEAAPSTRVDEPVSPPTPVAPRESVTTAAARPVASTQVDEPVSPPTPVTSQESVTTAAARPAASTSRDLDDALSTIARGLLSLQTHQIAALQNILASVNQRRLVDNHTRICTLPNTQLPLFS